MRAGAEWPPLPSDGFMPEGSDQRPRGRRARRQRTRRPLRLALVTVALTVFAGLLVVGPWPQGPVLVVISKTQGVHLADVVGAVLTGTAVLAAAVRARRVAVRKG